MPRVDDDPDYREEENRLRYERERERQRTAHIARDTHYPPEWAAQEFDEREEV